DLLVGGLGDDTLSGGAGSDILWGGDEQLPQDSFRILAGESVADKFELPPLFTAEARNQDLLPPLLMPRPVAGLSLPGIQEDGQDVLRGGDQNDWLFGGGDQDRLEGDGGNDYADGGAGQDEVFGGDGDDIVRGGVNDDVVHGDRGIDQLYGDFGRDYLFGDAGDNNGNQRGQRLWGGDGIDFLYAYAAVTINAPGAQLLAETLKVGDELHGGAGGDFLYGNLRQDLIFGDSGKDFLHGEFLSGPSYAENANAARTGGIDQLFGGTGEDKLYGGGGIDQLWGGADSDRLEGQDGSDTLYGGAGIDVLVLDVDITYASLGGERFDGHYGNQAPGDTLDDNATDILLIPGSNSPDTILISQQVVAGAAQAK